MNMYDKLVEYGRSGIYPMHMPGHKRNPQFQMTNPYAIDLTEVEGVDNLHNPQGMIRDLMNRMREYYGTRETYILVNGSTCGVLAAISACCHHGDGILVDRNCHRSVYHAIYLLGLKPIYMYRDIDAGTGIPLGLEAGQVEEALPPEAEPEQIPVSCAVVTSPTYEGVTSDIREIATVLHRRGIPLIVDAAHGAHLSWGHPLDEAFPAPATELGADVVVESLHKMLPSLTQTAVLHQCSHRVSQERIERYLDIYETSSPSYVLMASVGQCMEWMEKNSREIFPAYADRLRRFYHRASHWKTVSLWDAPRRDPSKLILQTGQRGPDGCRLAERLRREYKIEVEFALPGYVLAMTSPCDSGEGLERLAEALEALDSSVEGSGDSKRERVSQKEALPRARVCLGIYEAMNGEHETVPLQESVGSVAAEYALIYPPGIPFLVPGEEITEEVTVRIREAREKNLDLIGLADATAAEIAVCVTGGEKDNG